MVHVAGLVMSRTLAPLVSGSAQSSPGVAKLAGLRSNIAATSSFPNAPAEQVTTACPINSSSGQGHNSAGGTIGMITISSSSSSVSPTLPPSSSPFWVPSSPSSVSFLILGSLSISLPSSAVISTIFINSI